MSGSLAPLTRRRKAALVTEILWEYARVRFWLARLEPRHAVDRMRHGGRPPSRRPQELEAQLSLRLGKAVVRTVALLPTDSRCLMRSLVLTSMLSRRGIGSTVVIAAKPEPEFAAHAWVEYHGQPLIAPGGPEFGRLAEL